MESTECLEICSTIYSNTTEAKYTGSSCVCYHELEKEITISNNKMFLCNWGNGKIGEIHLGYESVYDQISD